jgi:hypothetical protein
MSNNTGYIYKLVSTDIEIKECYVGSTKNERVRKNKHKCCCNNEKIKEYNRYVYQFIRENGGFQNWDMVRLEEFKYNDKKDLHTRERYWIETLQASLNKQTPTRTDKEYYEDNKEKAHQYYEDNKENKKHYNKDYREKNIEILREKERNYRQKNKEQIAEKEKIKITCECGVLITKKKHNRHLKSKKHRNYSTENERSE